MVTFNEVKTLSYRNEYCEGVCLSSDTKPTEERIANGSKLLEMDTRTLYIYDKPNKTWRAWS